MIIRWRRHLAIAGSTSLLVTLVGASAADAKVFFGDLEGRTFVWDQRVSSTILNCPGNDSCREGVEGVVVYLRHGRRTRSRPKLHTLERVGRVSASGTLRFRVPHVRAGRYHLVARIPTDRGRRWLPASGTFRIRRG